MFKITIAMLCFMLVPAKCFHDELPSNPSICVHPNQFVDLLENATISSRFPELTDDILSKLIEESRKNAEMLFGTQAPECPFMRQKSITKRGLPETSVFPHVALNSSAAKLGNFNAMKDRVVMIGRNATLLLDVTRGLISSEIPKGHRKRQINEIGGLNIPQLNSFCPLPHEVPQAPLDDPLTPSGPCRNSYATMSQVCNNPVFPNRGKESTVYRRLLGASYSDEISVPRRSITGAALPSARLVSLAVLDTIETPGFEQSALAVHFGQFLAHDMGTSPQSRTSDRKVPECCNQNAITHPDCLPIDIPVGDVISTRFGRSCMEFVRTVAGVRPGCTLGPREQINQGTHFIDLSTVYGSTDAESQALRTLINGQLKSLQTSPIAPHFTLLSADSASCSAINGLPCFRSGDERINVQPGLTMLHTIWMRQHNRVASQLHSLNPTWSDQKLFNEARRINIAQYQHIIYNEYLPLILGPLITAKFELNLDSYKGYSVLSHPAVSSEFTAAAFRLHSTIPPLLALRNSDNSRAGSRRFRDSWFSPFELYDPGYFTKCAAGMIGGVWDKMDQHTNSDIQDHLFQTAPGGIGLDLLAIDIQRGRDHGLNPWVKYRELCGLRVPKDFDELKRLRIMPDAVVDRLRSVYLRLEDVDLSIAGSVEFHAPGSQVGATFACIIAEQFFQSRRADRFWYENNVFTSDQLTQIRKTTFSQILCANIDNLKMTQPRVFYSPNRISNERVPCGHFVDVDLQAWRTN